MIYSIITISILIILLNRDFFYYYYYYYHLKERMKKILMKDTKIQRYDDDFE
jgi:hypothetical protein